MQQLFDQQGGGRADGVANELLMREQVLRCMVVYDEGGGIGFDALESSHALRIHQNHLGHFASAEVSRLVKGKSTAVESQEVTDILV
jgi:hypothetical protein